LNGTPAYASLLREAGPGNLCFACLGPEHRDAPDRPGINYQAGRWFQWNWGRRTAESREKQSDAAEV
jgi:hypothetical protein